MGTGEGRVFNVIACGVAFAVAGLLWALKPEGFALLALEPGDRVRAEGPSQPLADGRGRVIEAHTVNGTPLHAR